MKFPKDFLFGSATAAHQIEGSNYNCDWYQWEKIAGNICDGSTSEIAADSWNEWQKDIELLKMTHQNSYRFSIEWSRIEPEDGVFDETAIQHYALILQTLRKNKIKSMVTLFHFTLPLWLARKGGATSGKIAFYFARFAKIVADKLGREIDFIALLNEPNVYTLMGYARGEWCPGKKNYFLSLKVYFNLVKMQRAAFSAIKKISKDLPVGIAINIAAYKPEKRTFINLFQVWAARKIAHGLFLSLIVNHFDFLGINHYMKFLLRVKKPYATQMGKRRSDYDWGIVPEGIYEVIKENAKWHRPIYITENGISDGKDLLRPAFIEENLEQIYRAIKEGVDVKGYYYWTLMDNFEWAAGYSQKFGLFTIDRKPRKSAFVYADLITKSLNS